MKRIFMFMTATVVFATVLFFSQGFNSDAAIPPGYIIGEVTLVGDGMLIIEEDMTHRRYELIASPGELRGVITGYRVEVTTSGGRVISLTRLGMPMQTEPAPYQKWKIIIPPGG
jgi:hypothetical protein